MIKYRENNKNSKGESAPWVIISHQNGKVISSHNTKTDAVKHLRQIEYFKNN